MARLLVCAARFLASAALCRYSSDRDDMQREHWKDASIPQIHRTMRQVRIGRLVMTRPNPARRGKTRPIALTLGGPGRLRVPRLA